MVHHHLSPLTFSPHPAPHSSSSFQLHLSSTPSHSITPPHFTSLHIMPKARNAVVWGLFNDCPKNSTEYVVCQVEGCMKPRLKKCTKSKGGTSSMITHAKAFLPEKFKQLMDARAKSDADKAKTSATSWRGTQLTPVIPVKHQKAAARQATLKESCENSRQTTWPMSSQKHKAF